MLQIKTVGNTTEQKNCLFGLLAGNEFEFLWIQIFPCGKVKSICYMNSVATDRRMCKGSYLKSPAVSSDSAEEAVSDETASECLSLEEPTEAFSRICSDPVLKKHLHDCFG